MTPSSSVGVGSRRSIASRMIARAAAWAPVRPEPAGRAPRMPAGRPASAQARALADLRAEQAPADQAGDGRGAVALGERRGAASRRRRRGPRLVGQLRQGGDLARPERPPREALARGEPRGRRVPVGGQPQPALVAGTDGRPEQGPGEVDEARVGERPQPAQQGRAALGRRQVAHGPRPPGQLVEEVELDRRELRVRLAQARLPRGRHLGDQLEPLEHARREHRADHRRQRREVPVGDQGGEAERERRQERAVAPDPGGDRADLAPLGRGRGTGADHDADRLAAALAERDEHGLAGLDRAERGRRRVGVGPGPGPGRGVDRDLDQHVAVVPFDGQLERGGHGPLPAQVIRIRRSPLRRFSCATIASISAAVRSTSPVSLVTTWS